MEEPFRRVTGVVLLRSAAVEEVQFRILKAAEVHLVLPVVVAEQQ